MLRWHYDLNQSFDVISKVASKGKDGKPVNLDWTLVAGWVDIEPAWPQVQPVPQWSLRDGGAQSTT